MYKIILIVLLLISYQFQAQHIKTPLGNEISQKEIKDWLLSKIENNRTPGAQLAIINEGKVVFNTSVGESKPNVATTDNTIFEGASFSKPLFAFFVMRLVEQGVLDLDTPLYTYHEYPDIAQDERYKKITARHVLSHQSGFPNWRDENGRTGLTIDFMPGTDFQYSGEGYQYLALALQSVLDTDAVGLQQVFHKEIAKTLDLKVTKYIQNAKNLKNKALAYKNGTWAGPRDFGDTRFGAAYGVHSNALDWSKFIIALMEKEGLSETSYKELFAVQKELPDDNPNKANGITHVTLGLYGGQLPFGHVYGHGGNNNKMFTSLFFFFPEIKWGAVLFTNSSYGEEMGLELLQYLMQ